MEIKDLIAPPPKTGAEYVEKHRLKTVANPFLRAKRRHYETEFNIFRRAQLKRFGVRKLSDLTNKQREQYDAARLEWREGFEEATALDAIVAKGIELFTKDYMKEKGVSLIVELSESEHQIFEEQRKEYRSKLLELAVEYASRHDG